MKIKRIHINNYRAFLINGDEEAARYVIDLPKGENLLIYGENGSGKSSLFKALREFLMSATGGLNFQKNLFYDEAKNSEQPFIGVTLEDDREHYFSAEAARTNTHANPAISEANITKGFISYRDLLKLHFRQDNKDPDLFSFFLGNEGLFTDMIVPAPIQPANKIFFGLLWEKIQTKQDEDALTDYNVNIAGQFQELENRANLLLKYFQKGCSLKLVYTEGEIKEGMINSPKISFEINLFGKDISGHDDVLNEARLTALAISVYLAYVLSLPGTDLRILFLDDVFIGLDMSNRIPLIKILTSKDLGDGTSFQPFQIFLTTYDREWFNLAKNYLDDNWSKAEFYVDSRMVERPLIRKSQSYKERADFHFVHGDYPACANYLRKAFEQLLSNVLPGNILHPGFINSDNDNSHVIVSKHHLSINQTDEAWFFVPKNSNGTTNSQPSPTGLQKLIDKFETLTREYQISFPLIEDLNRIKNRLLNPLSHHDLRSPIFKSELETGFSILEELSKIKSKILIDVSDRTPLHLFYDREEVITGKVYKYKFQLLENLIYLEYNGKERILNAECKPIARFLKSDGSEEPGEGKNQKSIYDLCRGICIHSAAKKDKKNVALDPNELLNHVYNDEGQTLKDLF